ncbi:MAG TPA: endonuclease/exonuclease/phosphatase family protein [Polyangiaceae bacterium]
MIALDQMPVLADGGSGAGLRTARGGVVISASDFNPERITLANDLLPAMPTANVGDRLPGATVGVMSYTFANYKLFTTQALPSLVSGGLSKEVSSLGTRRSIDLDIAAFNVENLDATDPASKFSQLAGILVNNLQAPDLVALEEIQDNNGATSNGVVDASATQNQLVAAITAAGGPSYSYRSINPVDGQDGGEPGGNIRVVFLYRTDRGLSFVERPGATYTTANSVLSGPSEAGLRFSPGRIDPTNGAFANSRKPLAGQFQFQGQTFFVIANHFNSKGGDDPLFGRFQPPTLSSEAQRVAQANVVKGFVSQLLTADANAQIIVLGDLNDFEFSAPLLALKSAGLSTLVERLPANERYTYVYQGNSQVLDQLLVSSSTSRHVVGYDVVHVNAEFADQASDHDPGLARLSFDHTAPVLTGPTSNPSVSATGPSGANVTFNVSALDDQDGALPVTCSPASGSLFAVGVTAVSCSAMDANGNGANFDFSVTVTAVAAASTPAPAAPTWLSWLFGFSLLALAMQAGKARQA